MVDAQKDIQVAKAARVEAEYSLATQKEMLNDALKGLKLSLKQTGRELKATASALLRVRAAQACMKGVE